MKNIFILFLALFSLSNVSISQSSCSTPAMFGSTAYSDSLLYGQVSNWGANDSACLNITGSTYWIQFQVCNSGTLELTLSCASGVDVDFVAFGPFSPPVACGFQSSDVVDCSFSAVSTETISFGNVVSGENYMIAISNFAETPDVFNLVQSFGTGSVCALACPGFVYNQEICKINSNYLTDYNELLWEKDPSFIGDYIIYRESVVQGVYDSIAAINYADSAKFIDLTSNINQRSYKYKIGTTDTCISNILVGNSHTTMHVQSTLNQNTGDINLNWNHYSGLAVPTYYVFRGTNVNNLVIYDSISASSNTYTDVSANFNNYVYAIGFLPSLNCNIVKSTGSFTTSNATENGILSVKENGLNYFEFFPNPSNGIIHVNFTEFDKINESLSIQITDLQGRTLVKQTINSPSFTVNLEDNPSGLYLIHLIISGERVKTEKLVLKN